MEGFTGCIDIDIDWPVMRLKQKQISPRNNGIFTFTLHNVYIVILLCEITNGFHIGFHSVVSKTLAPYSYRNNFFAQSTHTNLNTNTFKTMEIRDKGENGFSFIDSHLILCLRFDFAFFPLHFIPQTHFLHSALTSLSSFEGHIPIL